MPRPLTEIWHSVVEGDQGAWAELVRRYSPLVFTVARRAGLEAADAEDCAQYTWVALYRNRKRIRDPQRLPAWLMRTTRRQAAYQVRRLKAYPKTDLSPEMLIEERLPDHALEQLERQAMIELGLAELGPRCRTLIRLLFLAPEETSYKEIARALDVAPNSLGPIRSRCLKRLRKKLEELGYRLD
jgi:RNA polymerase sigma factor (sigma-70 family)